MPVTKYLLPVSDKLSPKITRSCFFFANASSGAPMSRQATTVNRTPARLNLCIEIFHIGLDYLQNYRVLQREQIREFRGL